MFSTCSKKSAIFLLRETFLDLAYDVSLLQFGCVCSPGNTLEHYECDL